jgi:hypothetical protein
MVDACYGYTGGKGDAARVLSYMGSWWRHREEMMRSEAISISYQMATKKLYQRLSGRVFHVTSPDNFVTIGKHGLIEN